jgi:hypothetical protein
MMDRKGYDKWLETADDPRSPLAAWNARQPEIDELLSVLRAISKEVVENGVPTACEETVFELAEPILAKYPEAT